MTNLESHQPQRRGGTGSDETPGLVVAHHTVPGKDRADERAGDGADQGQDDWSRSNPDRGPISRLGAIEIDWPRSLGYFGGIAIAVGMELVEPPLALFIAAVPLLRILTKSNSPAPIRFAGQVVEGAAKPVGGDSEGTLRVASPAGQSDA